MRYFKDARDRLVASTHAIPFSFGKNFYGHYEGEEFYGWEEISHEEYVDLVDEGYKQKVMLMTDFEDNGTIVPGIVVKDR